MNTIANIFAKFRQTTADDVSAAILTLAATLRGEQTDEPELTVSQAAKRLNVSADIIYDMVESKKLPCRRVGRVIRIQPSDLEAVGKPRVFKVRDFS